MRTTYRRDSSGGKRRFPRNIVTALKGSTDVQKKGRFARFGELCTSIRGVLSFFLLIVILIAVGLIFFLEYTRNVVLIESFNVTRELEDHGLNSAVLAAKIADEIELMRRSAIKDVKIPRFSPTLSQSFPDVVIPEAHVSLRSIVQYVREVFSRSPTRISGEALVFDKKIRLTVRVTKNDSDTMGSSVDYFEGEQKDLNLLINQAARFIVKENDPYLLASYLFNKNQLDLALETVRYAAFHNPSNLKYHREHDYWIYVLWGSILTAKGDFDGATSKYEEAIRIKPHDPTAYIDWGYSLERARKFDAALAQYQRACGFQNKEAAYGCNNWGYILETRQQYDDAQVKFAEASRLDPELPLPHVNMGKVWYAKDKLSKDNKLKAIAEFEKAMGIDPSFADPYNEWGNILLDEGNYNGAIALYRKAIAANSNYAISYGNWGFALQKLGKFEEAIDKYKLALDKDPFLENGYLNWGNLLYVQKKYAEAIALYEKAANLPFPSSAGYANWGYILNLQNKPDAAIEKLRTAIGIDHGNADAHKWLASALRKKKDYAGAIDAYKTATATFQDDLDIFNDWGDLLLEMKDYKSAAEKFETIANKNPGYSLAYLNWGHAMKGQGFNQRAIELYQKVIDQNETKEYVEAAKKEILALRRRIDVAGNGSRRRNV